MGVGAYAGVCVRLLIRYTGLCLLAGAGLTPHPPGSQGYHRGWAVVEAMGGNCRHTSWKTLGSGALSSDWELSHWHNLSLSVVGSTLSAAIDGAAVFHGAAGTGGIHPAGMASIRSGCEYTVHPTLQGTWSGRHPTVGFSEIVVPDVVVHLTHIVVQITMQTLTT